MQCTLVLLYYIGVLIQVRLRSHVQVAPIHSGSAHPLSELSHRLKSPTKLKKHHSQTKPRIIKKERLWSLSLKEFWIKKKKEKKKKLNPRLSFSSFPSLTSSASYYCLASWLHSGSPSPLLLLRLSLSFYFFSSISILDPHELTTLKATFVVHFLHLLSLSLQRYFAFSLTKPHPCGQFLYTPFKYIYIRVNLSNIF